MIELIQFTWSPFCIPQRRILEFSGARFKIINIPPQDRTLVWKLTKHQYYGVPIICDGAKVVFDDTDDQQIVANLLALHAGTAQDFVMIGPVVRAIDTMDPRLKILETAPGRPGTRYLGLAAFDQLAHRAGWQVARTFENHNPIHHVVALNTM